MGDEATALWTPQRRKAGRGPRNIGKTEGCLERRDAALVVGTTRDSFAFGTLVEVAG